MDRFYVEPENADSPLVLRDGEAAHVAKVLRKRVGDVIGVFDGHGRSVTARIEEIRRNEVRLTPLTDWVTEPEPRRTLTLATAVPKADRFKMLVEKATELGVSRIVPLHTERSVVSPRDSKLDRLRQTVVAACKQCGRNRLLELVSPVPLKDWLSGTTDEPIVVGDPNGVAAGPVATRLASVDAVSLMVGPEGGFTEDERAMITSQAAVTEVCVGRFVLRIETAGLALAARFVDDAASVGEGDG